MAKQFTPDILEAMLTRLTDKFTEMFKLLIEQMMVTVNMRIDRIDAKFTELCERITSMNTQTQDAPVSTVAALPLPLSPVGAPVSATIGQDSAFKTLLAVETEKAERAKRAFNVIITGLPVHADTDDADTFLQFCDENLTIRPRPIRGSCHRLGKSTPERPAKLRITFESSQTVEDLIQTSSMLRHSSNPAAKSVYTSIET